MAGPTPVGAAVGPRRTATHGALALVNVVGVAVASPLLPTNADLPLKHRSWTPHRLLGITAYMQAAMHCVTGCLST